MPAFLRHRGSCIDVTEYHGITYGPKVFRQNVCSFLGHWKVLSTSQKLFEVGFCALPKYEIRNFVAGFVRE